MDYQRFLVPILSFALSMLLAHFPFFELSSFVGVTTGFLYGQSSLLLLSLGFLANFLCSFSSLPYLILNPLFICHIALFGCDHLFLIPILFTLNTKYSPFVLLVIAVVRNLLIDPTPSNCLLWTFDVHFYTEFRLEARITVLTLELLSLFLSRHFANPFIGVFIYLIFDPCGDWAGIALAMTIAIRYVNGGPLVNGGFLLMLVGFVFNQSAFYGWWAMGTGNANFAMIGSLLYVGGILAVVLHLAMEKEKVD
jgi:hypothetical protein